MGDYLIKLVRDRTDKSLVHDEHDVVYSPVGHTTHVRALRRKLAEEVGEYLVEPSLDELVDIVEVCEALARVDMGVSANMFRARKKAKIVGRGGFMKGVGMFAREVGG